MSRFEFLSHVADARMHVVGATCEEVFHAALSGMNEMLKHGFCVEKHPSTIQLEVSLSSPDSTCLLIDFLSEVLTLSHIHNAIFCGIEIHELNEKELKLTLSGSAVTNFDNDIKAVTYHEANLCQNQDGEWETMLIFDI